MTENIYINTDKRFFYISDDIDNESIGKICASLLYLLAEDDKNDEEKKNYEREPIKIYVSSFGGSVYDMWTLIDIMLNSKTPIYTYCTGYAMSAGFKIFLAGTKRFASKHATFMYHALSTWKEGEGHIQDVKESLEECERLQTAIEEYIVARTKITSGRLAEVRDKKLNWFIGCDEALELGIIDETI